MHVNSLIDNVRQYLCLDYSKGMLSIARWRIKNICPSKCIPILGNVESLPIQDSTIDIVYSFTVLDLVDDLWSALEEFRRVARGVIIFSMLKKLYYKDRLLQHGYKVLGVSSKDVIFYID